MTVSTEQALRRAARETLRFLVLDEADSSSETMALYEAKEEGWKVDTKTQQARCPKHKGSGGMNLIALGAGAL